MFCPKCKYEYREDMTHCPDCEEPLVEKLEEQTDRFNPEEKICTLTTVANEFEADIIISKLMPEGIYACKHFRGSDGYNRIVLGRTILGVDILVAESDFETASEIIAVENDAPI